MQLTNFFVSMLLTTVVTAKGEGKDQAANKTLSTAGECNQMRQLTKLVDLAGNTTKLDEVTKGNATKASDLQAKASAASTQLNTLMSNTTLMSACATIDAAQDTEDSCQETFALQKFIEFSKNTTAVATLTENNQTKMDAIQAKASAASTKLDALTSNSTLQAFCPAVMQKDECSSMDSLQKLVDTANNQTKLDKVAKGNTTMEDKLKSFAAMAQTKLDAMMSNSTLMAACDALSKKASDTISASTSTTSSAKKSGAIKMSAEGLGMMSTMIVVAMGMFML